MNKISPRPVLRVGWKNHIWSIMYAKPHFGLDTNSDLFSKCESSALTRLKKTVVSVMYTKPHFELGFYFENV